MDLLTTKYLKKRKIAKLSSKNQQLFIYLLADLLGNGFTIQESFAFMEKSKAISKTTITHLVHLMEEGHSLMECLTHLGFQSLIVGQIELSHVHGDLPQTLKKISQHLRTIEKHKRYLYKTLSYPLLLFIFLIAVLISIRQVLLPQLLSTNTIANESMGLLIIRDSPYYIGGLFFFSLIILMVTSYSLKRKNSFQKALFFSKLPIYGKFYKKYLTAFFANEWGKLFFQGLEIKDVVYLMKSSDYTLLMNELSAQFEQAFLMGDLFHQQLLQLSFFLPELSLIIQQGEMKGHLGKELILYSELCWQQLFHEIEKLMNWIQPVVFLIIALLVVGVYGALLLPIYSGLEGFL